MPSEGDYRIYACVPGPAAALRQARRGARGGARPAGLPAVTRSTARPTLLGMRTFRQVDVFGSTPLGGNPVAVVHGADGLSDDADAGLRPLDQPERDDVPADADDRRGRLPAADLHPVGPSSRSPGTRRSGRRTPGSRRAGRRATAGQVVQECGAGLVTLRRSDGDGGRLAFAAPPLLRSGPVSDADRAAILAPARARRRRRRRHGLGRQRPGLGGRAAARRRRGAGAASPTSPRSDHDVGVVGPRDAAATPRARCARSARWAPGSPRTRSPAASTPASPSGSPGTVLPASYVAAQGTVIGRAGRVHVERDGDTSGSAATRRRSSADEVVDRRRFGPCRSTSTSSSGSSTRGSRRATAPAPAPGPSSATRCAST